ncbi:hypothetical protein C2D46_22555 [Escherichia coli]|nr:hypothetical protein [Escherichia coli]
MALPRKLKHLNLFNDGNNWQGIVESLTLPKFTRKYEKYRGGGMPGAVDVDLGLDDGALDTEFSIGGTELLLFKQMGKATVDGIQLRFTGSIQRDDIRFTCCCCDVYESSGGTARWTGRRRHGAASTGIWSTGDAARCPVCHIWSVRCSAQSDRSCGYCTGGRGAGCLEILATHHRISWWRGGRIQSGGRSRQCSIRTA